MADQKKQYQQAFKATSLFGGVQVLQILCSIIKSKVAALFLGPAGFGVLRLLRTTLLLTSRLTGLGLPLSAVKFISTEFTGGDIKKAYRTIGLLRRLLWLTGLLGALLLAVLSPFLSRWLFDSEAYTVSFILVGLAVLFRQLAEGQDAILQGLRKLRLLAKANVWGSVLALLIVAPLYYFFGEAAIAPGIVITVGLNFLLTRFFVKTQKIPALHLGWQQTYPEGKPMIKLGLALSFTGILTAITAYGLQLLIQAIGGTEELGLFSAGFLILNTYGALIFTAMAKDYYPRLAGIAHQRPRLRATVEQQVFIALLLITPIIIGFLAFAPQLIQLLFTEKFLGIQAMISWGIMGLLFKAVSFALGYVMIAKADTKIFLTSNIVFNGLQFVLLAAGYYLYGLTGLGAGFLLYYISHFIVVYSIDYRRYKFYFSRQFYPLFGGCILLCGLTFWATFLSDLTWRYSVTAGIFALSVLFSYYYLNKKINFVELIRRILGRN